MTQAGYFETRRFNPGSLAMAAAIEFALIASAVAWQMDVIVKPKPPEITILDIKKDKDPPPDTAKPPAPPKRTENTQRTETKVPPLGPDIDDITRTVREETETGPIDRDPPQEPPRILESARAKGDVRSLMTSDDYPEAARRRGETGMVRARLDIGANGKVTGCTIVASSGSAMLDSTTCRLLQTRARFAPAKNGNGELVSDSYLTPKIVWTIKQDG